MASHRGKQKKKNKKKKCYKASGSNRHHRLPKSRGGTDKFPPNNISVVLKRHHQMYNELFGTNPTAHQVAKILSDTWIDPRYVIVVMTKEEYNAYLNQDVVTTPPKRITHAQVVSSDSTEEDSPEDDA